MATSRQILERVFRHSGVKTVSRTDKNKAAYVLTTDQVAVMRAAGFQPEHDRTFRVRILGEQRATVEASYYNSERGEDAERHPEPRMGREFISGWLAEGDDVFLGTNGDSIVACRLLPGELSEEAGEALEREACRGLSDEELQRIAQAAPLHPPRRPVQRQEYARSAAIVELAKRRAQGRCEMPGCGYIPFVTDNEEPFLEVHHIVPLSEGGADAIENVAALCPNCHRAQHHSNQKAALRETLRAAIAAARAA
jgi:5-methylcytosine-specific restriction endonuclease McrA